MDYHKMEKELAEYFYEMGQLDIDGHNTEPLYRIIFHDEEIDTSKFDGNFHRYLAYHCEIQKEFDLAKDHLLIAIDKGDIKAIHSLGVYYQDVEKNYEEMSKCYLKSIEHKNVNSMLNMAVYCKKNEDVDGMIKYLEMAISTGSIQALIEIGTHYKEAGSVEKMLDYYERAIEKGSRYAMFNLALYYKEIDDTDNMVKYYKMAIHHGCIEAMNNLATFYHRAGDYENAVIYYKMCASKGIPEAIYNLGAVYEEVENYEQMMVCYRVAWRHGIELAKTRLMEYLDKNPDKRRELMVEDPLVSREFYNRSAK